MRKIFISAGDPSGNIHAARLMTELHKIHPDTEFTGIGGSQMIEAGLKSVAPVDNISVTGFYEVAKHFPEIRRTFKACEQQLRDGHFNLFLPVDYPGFNIRLAGKAKSYKLPVIYYIAPQLWAWGQNRAAKLAHCIDLLLVVFPFEVEFFSKFNINAHFVGHPLLDLPELNSETNNYENRKRQIAYLPGSRRQELYRHLPMIERVAEILKEKIPDLNHIIAKSNAVDPEYYKNVLDTGIFELNDNSLNLMKNSLAGVVKTGTSNLEAGLCGMPFSMFYSTSALSFHLSKKLINLPYISMINILSGKFVVKEFIQKDAKPEAIAGEIEKIVMDKLYYQTMQNNFQQIKEYLGSGGAALRAAEMIDEHLRRRH